MSEPMAVPSPQDDLRRAAKIVETALSRLNTRSHQCESCGLREYENFREAQTAKALASMILKLRKYAGVLEDRAAHVPGTTPLQDEISDDTAELLGIQYRHAPKGGTKR